jgi:hypothetical protein
LLLSVTWSSKQKSALLGLGSHQRHFKEEKTIIMHEWSFLPPNRKTYHLPQGHYKW